MHVPRLLRLNTRGAARPRVLVADDSVQVLESVPGFLATQFEVVAVASEGRQAVDLTLRLEPDVVVLDIAMPDLSGFQALHALRQHGSRARAVFLTMYRTDEFVVAAIGAGADGYVMKSRIHSDLISAIDYALAGRLFVPSLTSLSTVAGRSRHAAQFHLNDRFFLDEVGRLVDATLRSGEPVVVVASEPTRVGLAQRLRELDLGRLSASGQYAVQDSSEALSRVVHDGRLDKDGLAEVVEGLERSRLACGVGPNEPPGRLTIFGDMSMQLFRSGNIEAAIEMERTWNDLTEALPFLTVCGFPVDCFEHEATAHLFPSVCAEHSAVSHTPDTA